MQTANGKRWAVPLLCLFFGAAYLVVFWIAGNPGAGLGPFAIMVGYGALLFFGGRSEVVRVLRGWPSDERYRMFGMRAFAFAGAVMMSILIGGFFYELAQGRVANPYGLILAAGGVSYVVALVWLDERS